MLILLPLLAVLQYQWIGEVSMAERQRLSEQLNQTGIQLAQDFDREVMRVLLPFQRRGSMQGTDLTLWLTQRYDDAGSRVPEPDSSNFHWSRRSDDGLVLSKFDLESSQLQVVQWPAEFASLRQNLETRFDRGGRSGPPQGWEPLSTPDPVFLVSMGPEGEPRPGFRGGRSRRPAAEFRLDHRGTGPKDAL